MKNHPIWELVQEVYITSSVDELIKILHSGNWIAMKPAIRENDVSFLLGRIDETDRTTHDISKGSMWLLAILTIILPFIAIGLAAVSLIFTLQ